MKVTVLIAACLAIVAMQPASVSADNVVVEKPYLYMQKFVFEILLDMDHELSIEELIKLGSKLNTDKDLYTKYPESMTKFYNSYKVGGLLPRGEFFSVTQKIHLFQGFGLFEFFYYAKNWETFMQNAAWARLNVNEGMFVNALTLAVIHRADMQGIIMPQIYEIFPQMFFGSKYIMAAEEFDLDTFNRQIMLEKELKTIYQQEHPHPIFGKALYLKDWKVWQWWKLMGLDDGFQMESKSILSGNQKSADPQFSAIYSKLKMFWLPVDYTRDAGIFNADSKLSYFTEDVGWNAYWYYLNMDYLSFMPGKDFNLDKDRRGEWWIYNVQQLLARYYMERLSQGLGKIQTFSWYDVFDAGYDPQLVAFNGEGFTYRKNYWEVESHNNKDILNKIGNIERRIDDVIASGKFVMTDGTVVDFRKPESVEYVGNLLEGNVDVLEPVYFHHWFALALKLLSGVGYNQFTVVPHALMNFESMLRDPLFYSVCKIIIRKFYEFKYQLQPYTREELFLPGVKIADVEVSKLLTFFDLVDTDVTTLLNGKNIIHGGGLVWDKTLLFRQKRLNHKQFTYTTKVEADKPQKVVIRGFIAPSFDEYGEKLNNVQNRENYMEFDKFVYDLVAGENVINRSSKDFAWTASDPYTYSELYNYLDMSMEGKYKFQPNISQSHSLFPDRLVLPHGWVEGMPMDMFFMISPFTADFQQYSTYDPSYLSGIGSGVRHIDNMPFGYPLDRKIEDYFDFFVPNMFYKHVKIYHVDKLDKYYPMKYENYGSFDEFY